MYVPANGNEPTYLVYRKGYMWVHGEKTGPMYGCWREWKNEECPVDATFFYYRGRNDIVEIVRDGEYPNKLGVEEYNQVTSFISFEHAKKVAETILRSECQHDGYYKEG